MKSLLLSFTILFCSAIASAQGITDSVSKALNTANATMLGRYFMSSIHLTIEQMEGLFSKAEAVPLVSGFFTRTKPTGFKLIHTGKSKSGNNISGILNTANGQVKVSVNFTGSDSSQLINLIQFKFDE